MHDPHSLENLTCGFFANLLGNKFLLRSANGEQLEAELVSATALTRHHPSAREPFSLIFRVPRQHRVEQQIYRVQREQFDQHVFLVPIGPDNQGMRLEAIFN